MFIILLLLSHVALDRTHPIHISVSTVEISATEIKWTARIYKDDLLRDMYNNSISLERLDDRQKLNKDVLTYFSKKITIAADGKNLKWALVDIQSDHEAIWISTSTPISQTTTTSLSITNRILLDTYNDQKNVVNLIWLGGKKNFVFEKKDFLKYVTF